MMRSIDNTVTISGEVQHMEQANQRLDMEITARSLIAYALPTIGTLLFFSIYMMVGGVFVARLVDTNALSAMNIILPLANISSAIGMMLATGGSAVVAKLMGEGRDHEARGTFSFIYLAALVAGVVLAALGLIFLDPIITFLGGADALVYAYCHDYALWTLIFYPFGVIAMLMLVFVIAAGKALLGTILAVIGGTVTILLDWLCIAVFPLGIAGAAIATGVGYAVPSLIGFVFFVRNKNGTLYYIKPLVSFKTLAKSCGNGSSEMVTNLSLSAITLLLNQTLMRMAGADGVAAITIILYAQGLMNSAFMGYATGIAPIISYNWGKCDGGRLKRIYRISLTAIGICAVCIFAASLVFAEPLVGIFAVKGSEVYAMTVPAFRIFSVCFLFMGFSIFGSSMFTALSNGKVSAIISFMRALVLEAACILLLPQIFGLTGVWAAVPLAELLGLLLTFVYFRKLKDTYGYA